MCFPISAPSEAKEDHPPAAPNPVPKTLDLSQLLPSDPNPNGNSSVEENPIYGDAPMPLAVAPPSGGVIYLYDYDMESQQDATDSSSFFGLSNEDLALPYSSWNLSSSRVYAEEPKVWDTEQNQTPEQNWLFSGDDREPSANEVHPSGTLPSAVGAGLSNLGNTCFLNAILQCFTHTEPLVQGLRSCSHSFPCGGDNNGFCVICVLRDQIECSIASSGRTLSPLKLVDNLSYFSSSFTRYQQEDAHEFMQCTLDKLERRFLDLKNDKSIQDDNLVEKVFGGRLISKLYCCGCGHFSDTYEPLIDLSLEIENVDTLPSALESFTKVEKIDEKFKCDSCKEEVSMEKQLMLDQTPSVAAFHLKRFKTDGAFVQKIDKHVTFPLELDLQPYTLSDQNSNVLLKYDLYAVVVHTGFSSTSGHYFCFVRSAPDTWHKLDDTKVFRVSTEIVLAQEAYILFYAREGTPWFSSIMESLKLCSDSIALSTSPKSVLDVVENYYKPNPIITPNNEGEATESKDSCNQYFDYSCQEKLDVSGTGDASHCSEHFPGGQNQVSVGLGASKDTTHAHVPLGNNASALLNGSSHIENCYPHETNYCSGSNQESVGLNASNDATDVKEPSGNDAILNIRALFDGKSRIESGGLEKNKFCQEVDVGENNGSFHTLTPPTSPSTSPDAGYHIPRDHLKMGNRGGHKRPTNKHVEDSERKAAVKYVKKMHGTRRGALMQLVIEAPLKKKRKDMDSSLCKKASPRSVSKKANHSAVMRPVVAGISQL